MATCDKRKDVNATALDKCLDWSITKDNITINFSGCTCSQDLCNTCAKPGACSGAEKKQMTGLVMMMIAIGLAIWFGKEDCEAF
jgi:hypothetical protein